MATLPDLATTQISTLCYFDTTAVIKKSDILPLFESFVAYDNGVDGIISYTFDGNRVSAGDRVQIQVRIRTDGLVYAYGLRASENNAGAQRTSTGGGAIGFQRSLLPISGFGGAPAAQDTLLFRALQSVVNADTTAGKVSPTVGTVSYYDFEFTTTGNIYVFGGSGFVNNGGRSDPTWQFTQPPGVSIFVLGARQSVFQNNGANGGGSTVFSVQSTTLINNGTSGNIVSWSTRTGSLVTNALAAQGTQNNATIAFNGSGAGYSAGGVGTLVIYASS
ncbi:MAG: hypothetical protein WDA16_12115 [Candidatus Thermoplasmatota archaeon]